MAKSEVKLLDAWTRPYVMRAQIALNIKAVEYEFLFFFFFEHEYEFLEQTFGSESQLLLQYNPVYKKIPVLIHADNPICESLRIVEYMTTSGPPLPPSSLLILRIVLFNDFGLPMLTTRYSFL